MANLITPPELSWQDPVYAQALGTARQTYDTTVGGLAQQRGATAKQYGYTPTYDANGMVQSVAVDPTDPYAKANLLTKSYQEGQQRSTNSYAGRGQLYAGSLNAEQGRNTFGYNVGANNLQEAFINFIAANQGQMNQAGNTYNETVGGEFGNALGRYQPPAPDETAAAAPAASTPDGAYIAQGYNGPNGMNSAIQGPSGIYYYDSSGAPHQIKVTDQGRYYQTSSGKWAPLPAGVQVVGA